MGNNLQVKISADVVSLQIEFAKAKAAVSGLQRELNDLAKQSQNGPLTDAQKTRMSEVAEQLIRNRQEASRLGGELQKAGVNAGGFGGAAHEMGGSISTATREFRALFDELSAGRTKMVPGTLAIIASRVFGLGPAALAATAGIGILAAGLAYLGVKAIETSRALDQMKMGRDMADNLELSTQKMQDLVAQMSKSADISKSEALKLGQAIFGIPGMTEAAATAVAGITPRFVSAFGIEAEKMPEVWDKILNPGVSAESAVKVLTEMHANISSTQREMAETADRSQNSNEVLATKLEIVNQVLNKTATTQIAKDSAMTRSATNFLGTIGLLDAGLDAQALILDDNKRRWTEQSIAIDQATAALRRQPAAPDQDINVGMSIVKKENPVSEQIAQTIGQITQLNRALEAAKQKGDQVTVDRLNAALQTTQERLNSLQFGPVLERMRTGIEEVSGSWNDSQTKMLIKQREVAQGAVAEIQRTLGAQAAASKEYLTATSEVARLSREIRRSEQEDVVNATRHANEQIAADTSKSSIQRLTEERANLQKLVDERRVTGQTLVQVQKEIDQQTVQLNNETRSQEKAVERSDVDTSIAISRMKLEATRENLQAELNMRQAHSAEVYAQLKSLTQREFELDIQRVENERNQLGLSVADYERMANEIKRLRAQLNLDLAKLDREQTAAARKELQEEASAWRGFVSEVTSAEGQMLQSLLARRASFGQAALTLVGRLVDDEIVSFAKAVTIREALGNDEIAQEKARKAGGLAYHILVDDGETAKKAAGAAARGAISKGETAEEVSSDTASQVSALKKESTRTSAKTTGVSIRSSVSGIESTEDVTADTTSEASAIRKEATRTTAKTTGVATRSTMSATEATADEASDSVSLLSAIRKEAAKIAQKIFGVSTRSTVSRTETVADESSDVASAVSGSKREATRTSEKVTGVAARSSVSKTETASDVSSDAASEASATRKEASRTSQKLTGVATRSTVGKTEATEDVASDTTSELSATRKEATRTAQKTAGVASRQVASRAESTADVSSDAVSTASATRKEVTRTSEKTAGVLHRDIVGRTEAAHDATSDTTSVLSGLRKETARTSQKTTGVASRTAVGHTETANDTANDNASIVSSLRKEVAKTAQKSAHAIARIFTGKGEVVHDVADDTASSVSKTKSEAAQTGAATTGALARTSIQTSADAEAIFATMSTGAAIIQAYAAEAAAAAGASVAAIPYVGWAMVPETMATTYGEVMAYMGGLDRGAWEVPTDGFATIHKGESVVPKDFASGLRSSGAVMGDSAVGDTFGDTNVTNHFHQPMPTAAHIINAINQGIRNAHPSALRMRRR